jgi:hypothetical protein
LLEILIWVHYKGMWIKNLRICPIRIEIIYGRSKFVGDFNMGNNALSAQMFLKIWSFFDV